MLLLLNSCLMLFHLTASSNFFFSTAKIFYLSEDVTHNTALQFVISSNKSESVHFDLQTLLQYRASWALGNFAFSFSYSVVLFVRSVLIIFTRKCGLESRQLDVLCSIPL